MYDNQLIQDAFLGLVGLRQNNNPDFEQLSSILTYTGQNILVHHSLINIENIDMTARNYSHYNFPVWAIGTTYETGDRVKVGSQVYESLQDANVGNDPTSTSGFWEEISLLSLYLEDVFRNSIDETVQEVFLRKKLSRQTKTLLQNQRLSTTSGGFNDRVINEGDLVGCEFKLKHNQNIKAVLNQIGFQLTGPQTFNVYLYHSSQLEPIATKEIVHTKTGSFEWHELDFDLNFKNDLHDAGGVFYIMYDQNNLGVQAIKKKHNWHKPPCSYCNRSEINYFNLYTKYLYLRTVRVKAVNRNQDNDIHLWDLEKTQYVSDNNFGLNFEWTVKCDLTNYIISQKQVFAFALKEMVTKKLLENMSNSTRQNGLDEKVRMMARSELQSKHIGGMGIMEKVDKQINGVDFEISSLDATCMPCNTKGGLRTHAAGLSHGR